MEDIREAIEMAVTVASDMMKNEQLAGAVAIFYWNLFSALQEMGFSKEDALTIVKNTTVPGSNQK